MSYDERPRKKDSKSSEPEELHPVLDPQI